MAGTEPEADLDRLEAAVGNAEATSAAELVAVLANRSSRYPEARARAGLLLMMAALGMLIFLPFGFHPVTVLVDAALAYLLGSWLTGRSVLLQRWFSLTRERQEAVEQVARVVFCEEAVSGTRDRTGILFYYSALEQEGRILPDFGIEQVTEMSSWHRAERALCTDRQGTPARRLERSINGCAALLSQRLPRPEDDQDEIPNRPRIREL